MKILSWNFERPKMNQVKKINQIQDLVQSEDPDLIFAAESNLCINFGNEYFVLHSEALPSLHDGQHYCEGENRISIYSKYPFRKNIATYDSLTSICGQIETPMGALTVYGSIIGSFGGRGIHFNRDLEQQKNDIQKLKGNICFSGDFNISFSGWKYPSLKVIDKTRDFFDTQNLEIVTENNSNSVIHTIFNRDFLADKIYTSKIIEIQRQLSDHHPVVCEVSKKN